MLAYSLICGYHELLLQPADGCCRLLRNVGLHIQIYTASQDCNLDIYIRYDPKSYLREQVLPNRNLLTTFAILHDSYIQCLEVRNFVIVSVYEYHLFRIYRHCFRYSFDWL